MKINVVQMIQLEEGTEYSVYVYGSLGIHLFPNKRLNVNLKNIEIRGTTWPLNFPFSMKKTNIFQVYIIQVDRWLGRLAGRQGGRLVGSWTGR